MTIDDDDDDIYHLQLQLINLMCCLTQQSKRKS